MTDENPNDLIATTQSLVEELKRQNAEYRGLVERHEKLRVVELLSGKGEAGIKPKSQDEIDQEKADELIKRFI